MKIIKLRIMFSALLLCALSIPAAASNPSETAELRVRKMMEATSVPGMSVSVIKNGKTIWSKGFGKADLENSVPVTAKTRFRLASVSKVVTAAAVARLVDAGKLDLDAPISTYVKDLPVALGAVTARQLTGHLAGVRHYQQKDFVPVSIDNKNFPTVVSSLSIFKDDPLESEPGTTYRYTTFGFTVLAAVIQGASGQPFLEFLKEQVFKPLALDSAGPDSPFLVIPNRTSFYMNGPQNSILNATFVNPSYKWAGGGMLMTADDLARFGFAHLRTDFIEKATLETMFTSQETSDENETGVGITWRIAKGFFGNRIYHHEGSMHGTRSALLLYPDQDLVIAFMTNLSGTPNFAFQTAQLIAQPFLDEKTTRKFKPEGIFEVAGKALRREVKGTLTVNKTINGYTGVFDFGTERFNVIEAIPHKKGHYLIVIHPRGGLDAVPIFEDGENGSRYDLTYVLKSS